ncbi:MAG: hypothetical protein QF363_13745 [Planctomycetaceae bacterium]|nr:hypothetical protein [Planctomycetaceae bacterium]
MAVARHSPADSDPGIPVDATRESSDARAMNALNSPLDPPQPPEQSPPPLNPFFRIAIITGGLFVLTIFAMIAATLGSSAPSPALTAFEDNIGWILGIEVLVILGSAFTAMVGDQQDPPNSHPDTDASVDPATD